MVDALSDDAAQHGNSVDSGKCTEKAEVCVGSYDTGSEPQKPITPIQLGQDLSRPKMAR